MHMMLQDEPSDLEANVSLNEHQFKTMIESVRCTEVMLG
jgi:sialic acid synthase SpsE